MSANPSLPVVPVAAAAVLSGVILWRTVGREGRLARRISAAYPWADEAVGRKIVEVAEAVRADPFALANLIQFESGGNPAARNPSSGATGLIQFLPQCLSTDTLALTPSGWKHARDLAVGDAIIAFNATTGVLEMDEVQDLFIGPATNCMRMHNKQFDFVATADHRWYCGYRGTHKKGLPEHVEVRTTEELSAQRSLFKIIRAAPYRPATQADTSNALCELVGVIAGDGTISRQTSDGRAKPQVTIYQSRKAKPKMCDRIAGLLDTCRIAAEAKPHGIEGMVRWSITGDRARHLLAFFNATTPLKVLDKTWLFTLGPEQLAALQRGYLDTDGSVQCGKYQNFTQTAAEVMDDFQLVALLRGQVTNVRVEVRAGEEVFPGGLIRRVRDRHYASIQVQAPRTDARANRMNYTPVGPVEVWCPTTRNRTWVAKRGGFVTVTGNTATRLGTSTGALASMPALLQMDWVKAYLLSVGKGRSLRAPHQLAMAVFHPAAMAWPRWERFPWTVIAANGFKIWTPEDYLDRLSAGSRLPRHAGILS